MSDIPSAAKQRQDMVDYARGGDAWPQAFEEAIAELVFKSLPPPPSISQRVDSSGNRSI